MSESFTEWLSLTYCSRQRRRTSETVSPSASALAFAARYTSSGTRNERCGVLGWFATRVSLPSVMTDAWLMFALGVTHLTLARVSHTPLPSNQPSHSQTSPSTVRGAQLGCAAAYSGEQVAAQTPNP